MGSLEYNTVQLISTIVHVSEELNGKRAPTMFDGGIGAKRIVGECINELETRSKQDTSIQADPRFLDFFKALASVKDITNAKEIANAIKHIKLPAEEPSSKQRIPPKNNPFS